MSLLTDTKNAFCVKCGVNEATIIDSINKGRRGPIPVLPADDRALPPVAAPSTPKPPAPSGAKVESTLVAPAKQGDTRLTSLSRLVLVSETS